MCDPGQDRKIPIETLADGKGSFARGCLEQARVQSCKPANRNVKAQSPDKLAPHSNTQGLGDTAKGIVAQCPGHVQDLVMGRKSGRERAPVSLLDAMKPTGQVSERRVVDQYGPTVHRMDLGASRSNLQRAWKRFRADPGAPGIGKMPVDRFAAFTR